ncbi:MAG: hypothetical protein ACR2NG_09750, partial [Acidimicrobiia bacterium]
AEIHVNSTTDPVWVYVKPRDLAPPIHDGPHSEYGHDPRYMPGDERDRPNRGFGEPRTSDG